MPPEAAVHEAGLGSRRLRDLGLAVAGTPLEAVIREFQQELDDRGVVKVRPHFYLSTEWGVPFGTISIAIPFYLARVDLTDFHAERGGFVEGGSRADVLRYLRHEMGHVVNYAYRLYELPEWTAPLRRHQRLPTRRNTGRGRSTRATSSTCPAGTPRSTPTRTGPRRSRSG